MTKESIATNEFASTEIERGVEQRRRVEGEKEETEMTERESISRDFSRENVDESYTLTINRCTLTQDRAGFFVFRTPNKSRFRTYESST